MGHYRSEMGYEEEDAKEAKRLKERRKKFKANIEKQIEKDGVSAVLADLIEALVEHRVYIGAQWERD